MILYEQHSLFYHTNYIQACCIYQFSFFLVKMVNHYANHANFLDTQHLPQEYILYQYLHRSFFMKYPSISGAFSIQKNPSTGNGSDTAQPSRLFASKYSRNEDSSFLS